MGVHKLIMVRGCFCTQQLRDKRCVRCMSGVSAERCVPLREVYFLEAVYPLSGVTAELFVQFICSNMIIESSFIF